MSLWLLFPSTPLGSRGSVYHVRASDSSSQDAKGSFLPVLALIELHFSEDVQDFSLQGEIRC